MKIEKNEFSFEESLKYIDRLVQQMTESQGLRVFRSMDAGELPADNVLKVFCAAMSIKLLRKETHTTYHLEYVYAGVVSQIMAVLQSANQLRTVDMQADGGIMVLLDAPMKKDVEDIINLSAQVRSIKDVVLRKFHLPLDEMLVSVGIDYGPVTYFASNYTNMEGICNGNVIARAKQLAEAREDSVNITEDIYMNLSEDMQKNLFGNKDIEGEMKYYFSPLINLRMRKWVVENQ